MIAIEHRHVGHMLEWSCRGCGSVMQSRTLPAPGEDRCAVCFSLEKRRRS